MNGYLNRLGCALAFAGTVGMLLRGVHYMGSGNPYYVMACIGTSGLMFASLLGFIHQIWKEK